MRVRVIKKFAAKQLTGKGSSKLEFKVGEEFFVVSENDGLKTFYKEKWWNVPEDVVEPIGENPGEVRYKDGKAYCSDCGKELKPAPAWFDGDPTFVGYYPCNCRQEAKERTQYLGSEENPNERPTARRIQRRIHATDAMAKFERAYEESPEHFESLNRVLSWANTFTPDFVNDIVDKWIDIKNASRDQRFIEDNPKSVHCTICGKRSPSGMFEDRMRWLWHHRKHSHPTAHKRSVKKSLETRMARNPDDKKCPDCSSFNVDYVCSIGLAGFSIKDKYRCGECGREFVVIIETEEENPLIRSHVSGICIIYLLVFTDLDEVRRAKLDMRESSLSPYPIDEWTTSDSEALGGKTTSKLLVRIYDTPDNRKVMEELISRWKVKVVRNPQSGRSGILSARIFKRLDRQGNTLYMLISGGVIQCASKNKDDCYAKAAHIGIPPELVHEGESHYYRPKKKATTERISTHSPEYDEFMRKIKARKMEPVPPMNEEEEEDNRAFGGPMTREHIEENPVATVDNVIDAWLNNRVEDVVTYRGSLTYVPSIGLISYGRKLIYREGNNWKVDPEVASYNITSRKHYNYAVHLWIEKFGETPKWHDPKIKTMPIKTMRRGIRDFKGEPSVVK